VRIAAREKDLPFEWILSNDSHEKSPTLYEDGFRLTESLVIIGYLDEAHPGNDLQALGARERATMRVRTCELSLLEDDARAAEGYQALDRMLADERVWLGGNRPDLSDISIWPFLWKLGEAGWQIPPAFRRAATYWARACERESLISTRPR
jgi:glutathione S-transferase